MSVDECSHALAFVELNKSADKEHDSLSVVDGHSGFVDGSLYQVQVANNSRSKYNELLRRIQLLEDAQWKNDLEITKLSQKIDSTNTLPVMLLRGLVFEIWKLLKLPHNADKHAWLEVKICTDYLSTDHYEQQLQRFADHFEVCPQKLAKEFEALHSESSARVQVHLEVTTLTERATKGLRNIKSIRKYNEPGDMRVRQVEELLYIELALRWYLHVVGENVLF